MKYLIIFLIFYSLCQKEKIEVETRNKGDSKMVSVDATNIPWGIVAGHDAFTGLSQSEIEMSYRVLEDSSEKKNSDNRVFMNAMFKNISVFHEVTEKNIEEFTWNKKPFFMVLLCDCDRDRDWGMSKFISQLKEKTVSEFNFLYAFPETIKKFSLVSIFQIRKLPTIVIDNIAMGMNNEKYEISEDISTWSWRDEDYAVSHLIDFVNDFLSQKLDLIVRSEDESLLPGEGNEGKGKVWDFVGRNFKRFVIDDNQHDYLLMVYSPNSPACKALMPLFHDFAESVKDVPSIRVGTFDKTKNDFPIRGLFLKYYPTIYFFPAKHKSQSVNFFDFRTFRMTENGLLDFVHENADIKFNKKKVEQAIANKPEKAYGGDCHFATPENFDSLVKDPSADVFVDFFAPWCAYCKMMMPDFEELCSQYKGDKTVKIVKFDCSKYETFSQQMGIRSFPTLLLFQKDNKEHPVRFEGRRDVPTFKNFLESKRKKEVKINYGTDGNPVSKENPCLLKNGENTIDLKKLRKADDDYFVKSDNSEYEFFFNICGPTQRKCVNKPENTGAIQIGVNDPKSHCYILGGGSDDSFEAHVVTKGETPTSEIIIHKGESADGWLSRQTRIVTVCEPDESKKEVKFIGEDSKEGVISYSFEVKSPYACNQ